MPSTQVIDMPMSAYDIEFVCRHPQRAIQEREAECTFLWVRLKSGRILHGRILVAGRRRVTIDPSYSLDLKDRRLAIRYSDIEAENIVFAGYDFTGFCIADRSPMSKQTRKPGHAPVPRYRWSPRIRNFTYRVH